MNEYGEERVGKLLLQLKKMGREIPTDLQQREPYELLSELASSLAQVLNNQGGGSGSSGIR